MSLYFLLEIVEQPHFQILVFLQALLVVAPNLGELLSQLPALELPLRELLLVSARILRLHLQAENLISKQVVLLGESVLLVEKVLGLLLQDPDGLPERSHC